MTRHQKRLSAPDSWPVERKTETFTVKARGPHGDDGVPLQVLLRDVLGYVDSAKEASYAVNTGGVLVNGESVSDARRPIGMFDIVAFPDRAEYYRVFPDEDGRLGLTPIDADAAESKLAKVVDKTVVDGGRTQLNLHDGANLLVDGHEIAAGDSVVVANDDDTIVAHFPYEEGALVTAVDGSHAGEIGTVAETNATPGSSPNNVVVEQDDGGFETVAEYVFVIDENFTGGEASAGGESDDDAEPDAEAETDDAEPDAEAETDDAEPDAEEETDDAEAESVDAEADAETDDAEEETDDGGEQ